METETASVMIRLIAQKVAIKQASDEESYSVPHQYAAGVTEDTGSESENRAWSPMSCEV